MELSDLRKEHIIAIKKRINIIYSAYHNKGGNYNSLTTELNKGIENYNIQYLTLRKTLNQENDTLDLFCIIALCKHFDVSVSAILAEPDSESYEKLLQATRYNEDSQSILNDPKYAGTYFGYFYSTKTTNSNIDQFILTISNDNPTRAHLKISWRSISHSGIPVIKEKELKGTPILVDPSNIYIIFRNPRNDHIIMSFSYVKYRLDNLYFRRGSLVTMRTESLRVPLTESFVMFDKKISDEELEYIPGFLLLNDSDFHITKNDFDRLIDENSDVEYLHDNLSNLYNSTIEPVITINENQILSSKKVDISKERIVRGLLILKKYALDAKQVSYPEIPEFSEFSKHLKKQDPELEKSN